MFASSVNSKYNLRDKLGVNTIKEAGKELVGNANACQGLDEVKDANPLLVKNALEVFRVRSEGNGYKYDGSIVAAETSMNRERFLIKYWITSLD